MVRFRSRRRHRGGGAVLVLGAWEMSDHQLLQLSRSIEWQQRERKGYIMKTYHHNGENWYCNTHSLLKRIRRWFIWIGGWEKANSSGWKLCLTRYDGTEFMRSPTPIALFGHRIVCFNWGIDFRFPRRWLCIHWSGPPSRGWRIYLSQDATPSRADLWLLSPPYEVRKEAEQHVI